MNDTVKTVLVSTIVAVLVQIFLGPQIMKMTGMVPAQPQVVVQPQPIPQPQPVVVEAPAPERPRRQPVPAARPTPAEAPRRGRNGALIMR